MSQELQLPDEQLLAVRQHAVNVALQIATTKGDETGLIGNAMAVETCILTGGVKAAEASPRAVAKPPAKRVRK